MNNKFFAIAMAIATLCCVAPASAQILGGSASAGASGSANSNLDLGRIQSQVEQRVNQEIQQRVQSEVQSRVQNQVQARVQQQVQARIQNQVQAQIQNQIQGQILNQVQGQVQAQIQAQVQNQVQNQVQSRIQTESARAANIALQLSTAAAERVEAASRSGIGVRLGANVTADSRLRSTGNSADLRSNNNVGLNANLSPSVKVTAEDVTIYDSIFGRFNPLVEQSQANLSASSRSTVNGAASASTKFQSSADAKLAQRTLIDLNSQTDFASRIAISARQRQAEISKIRDEAIVSGNAQLLTQADAMESRLTAFAEAHGMVKSRVNTTAQLEAQAKARAQAQAMAETRDRIKSNAQPGVGNKTRFATGSAAQSQAMADAQAKAAAQAQLQSQAEASAQASGRGSLEAGSQSPRTINQLNGSANGSVKAAGSTNSERRK